MSQAANPGTSQDTQDNSKANTKDTKQVFSYPIDIQDPDKFEGHVIEFTIYDTKGAHLTASKTGQDTGQSVDDLRNGLITGANAIKNNANSIENESATTGYNVLDGLITNIKAINSNIKSSPVVQGSADMTLGVIQTTEYVAKHIFLYMPSKVKSTYSFGWETTDLANIKLLTNSVGDLVNGEFGKAIGDLARVAGQEVLAGSIDSLVQSATGLNLNLRDATEALTRQVRNPYVQFLFKSVETRTFDFSFVFAPRSLQELNEVYQIIYHFKYYAHPSIDSNKFYLNYPAEFGIQFLTIDNSQKSENNINGQIQNTWINRILRCALAKIDVDYNGHGDGFAAFQQSQKQMSGQLSISGAAPVHISLSLSFKELNILTRDDISAGY